MNFDLNTFLRKKILIYGLGKSGISAYEFLKKDNKVFLYDDFEIKSKNLKLKKNLISYNKILNSNFDYVILSPGIDLNKCKLSNFLKKNLSKIFSDLDVFYTFYKNSCITITGTNGKSTTCKLLYEIFKDQKFHVKLVGNIGNPILTTKNIKKKTIFIVEASSYQLEYSKLFKSSYAAILNLAIDHIERHKSLSNYIKAKFRLLKNQNRKDYAFLKKSDPLIKKHLKLNKYKSKIIKVDTKNVDKTLHDIKNDYFLSDTNKENLSFVLEISKRFNLKKKILIKTLQNFKGLKYRQEIILRRKNLLIINDSKSTSLSSSESLLKKEMKIYWLIGGIFKKKDKLNLQKKYFKNIKAYIFGKNKNIFKKILNKKIENENFSNLEVALKKILTSVKKNRNKNQMILFSPSAASFDEFKNFEERGSYFNNLIKKNLSEI